MLQLVNEILYYKKPVISMLRLQVIYGNKSTKKIILPLLPHLPHQKLQN